MSKTTKIIAGLGIVAGLGVAAMPAITRAAQSTTGDAEVVVEVTPAISLQIDGNNDTTPYSGFFDTQPASVYTADPAETGKTYSSSATSSSRISLSSNQIVEGTETASQAGTGYANHVTKVLYGVSTAAATPVDVYQNNLTYTATTAN